jgi:hypothetical protein
MIGRWLYASGNIFGKWAFSLVMVAVLTGQNILDAALSALWLAIRDTPLIIWGFDLLAQAGFFLNGLYGLALTLVAFVAKLFLLLESLGLIVQHFWNALMTAFNATSYTTTGMPADCSAVTSTEDHYALCQGLSLFDHVLSVFPSLNALGLALTFAIGIGTGKKTWERIGNFFSTVK